MYCSNGINSEEDWKVKNGKRAMKRAVCALLIAAVLCSDAGVAAYAAEAELQQQEFFAGAADETPWEAQMQEGQAEEAAAEEAQLEEDQAEAGNTQESAEEEAQPEGDQAETGNTEESIAGEPQEDASDAEAGTVQENPSEEDDVSDGGFGVEDENAQGAPAEETVSENAVDDTEMDVAADTAGSSVASGTYLNTQWDIDADGKLTVTGTGEFAETGNMSRVPWYAYKEQIKSAKIKVTGMSDASYMFFDCGSLTELDLSEFDTSSVTNMRSMFSNCDSLTELDLSKFGTSNVTDMSGMFFNCYKLTALDLSKFDTSNVTDMGSMFSGCESLTALELSEFNTSKVTNMGSMFKDCKKLETLNVGSFDTSAVDNVLGVTSMFEGCENLKSLDVSSFDTSKVTNMYCMFFNCRRLETLTLDKDKFKTGSVERMYFMFGGCQSLTSLDVGGFDTSNVWDMCGMFSLCQSLTSLELDSFDTGKVTDMSSMFSGCYSLASLDLSGFDTSKVTKMGSMFNQCSGLKVLDLSSFDASNVSDAKDMVYLSNAFALQTVLTPRNLAAEAVLPKGNSGTYCWYTAAGEQVERIPKLDHSIIISRDKTPSGSILEVRKGKTIYQCGETIDGNDITVLYYEADGTVHRLQTGEYITNAGSINTAEPGRKTLTITYTAGNPSPLTGEIGLLFVPEDAAAWGEYKEDGSDTAWWIAKDGKLTLEGTGEFAETGNMYSRAPWYAYKEKIKSAKIQVTGMRDASGMFNGCSSLTEIDLSGFATGSVTDMSGMFNGCSSLAKLDLSGFDTSSVTDMGTMFYKCSSLTKLDLSNFKTGSVTDMSIMFSGCSSLASLELGGFATSSVTNMYSMFNGCSSLAKLDLSSFATSSVTRMDSMFRDCSSLTVLDLSSFDTSKVTHMRSMFEGSSKLTRLHLDSFVTENVKWMEGMFSGCSALETLTFNAEKFATSNVEDMGDMFDGCGSLTALNVSQFATSKVRDMGNMFRGCGSLTALDVSRFDTGSVVYSGEPSGVSSMFEGCSGLTELDLRGFQTDQIEKMDRMFYNCSSLATLVFDADKFQTSAVKDMNHMFYNCSSLTGLHVEGFDTGKVTDMNGMFEGCSSLSELELGKFQTGEVTNMSRMFKGCSGLRELDLSKFDTGKVTDMGSMFEGCSGLTALDVSGFQTDSVHSRGDSSGMSRMFAGCESLTELHVNGFDTRKVAKMDRMFEDCSSLIYLYLFPLSYYSSDAKNMDYMFHNCSALTDLDLDDFNGENLESAENMFAGCDALYRIETPYQLEVDIALPEGIWHRYDDTGASITYLPKNTEESVSIYKEVKTVFPTIKVEKTKTRYVCGETIQDDDITVIYQEAEGVERPIEKGKYTTNADRIGTKMPGMKTLVVTYQDGEGTPLTGRVILFVTKDAEPETIGRPAASPDSGQLSVGDKVTLTCGTDGAQIYYTMGEEGDQLEEPTEQSVRYTEPIVIEKEIYIKAVAVKDGESSETAMFHYTLAKTDPVDPVDPVEPTDPVNPPNPAEPTDPVNPPNPVDPTDPADPVNPADPAAPAVPTAEPESGTVDRGSYVVLKADAGVAIYYTKDGSDPVSSATARLYEGRIRVEGNAGSVFVIKAAARKDGVSSKPVTFTYIISEKKEEGFHVRFADGEEFTYTGSAVTPAVIVSYNGEELTESVDYTLKYANNKNAAEGSDTKAPKITVTGKGNLSQSMSLTFTIHPKDIGDADVFGDSIVTEKRKTAAPALFYNGVKLTAKDFDNPKARDKYDQDGIITITGKGNFKGTRSISVKVVDNLKKLTVVVDNAALKRNPFVYDGTEKKVDGYFQVYDAKDKTKTTPLKENDDYAVIYPRDIVSAGKVSFTVVGLGNYCGTVSKSYTIRPRAVKKEADGKISVNVTDGSVYPYKNGGAIIPGITVTCNEKELVFGKDYKVAYSGNKKVCTNNSAKCKISFIGNYKGSAAITRSFNISAIDLNSQQTAAAAAIGDVVYTGKRGTYRSTPYVTVNGALLKSSEYKVFYYADADMQTPLDGRNAAVELTDGQNSQTVYVKIEGKENGNYKGSLTAQYNVWKADGAIDLSKAKIQFAAGSRVTYTGGEAEPAIKVMYKEGREWKTISADDIGTSAGKPVTVSYINNVNKGKATVMIQGGGGKFVGSKTASFSIVAKSIR